jgi:hypothetical protein
MKLAKSEFLPIPEAPGYEVSADGIVRNQKTGQTLTSSTDGAVTMIVGEKRIRRSAATLATRLHRPNEYFFIKEDVFLPVSDAPSYEVSSAGVVRKIKTGRVLKPTKGKVSMYVDGKYVHRRVDRLVMRAHRPDEYREHILGDEDTFRAIPELPGYEVSATGSVRCTSIRGKVLSAHISEEGYKKVSIGMASGRTSWFVHRLVMMAHKSGEYAEGREYGMTVDHINGDRLDNRPENLRMATGIQQAENRRTKSPRHTSEVIRRGTDGKIAERYMSVSSAARYAGLPRSSLDKMIKNGEGGWAHADDVAPGENWVKVAPNVEVSQTGRLRRGTRIVILSSKNGYPCTTIAGKQRYLHRLVAEAFLGSPPTHNHVINHIDGNKMNSSVENLEWVTQSANMRHAHETGLIKRRRSE